MFHLFRAEDHGHYVLEYVNPLLTKFNLDETSPVDLTVLTYELLSLRALVDWDEIEQRIAPYLSVTKKKVAFAQDDYTSAGYLDRFLAKFRFDAVYSAIKADHELIYRRFKRIGRIEYAQTGYFYPEMVLDNQSHIRHQYREIDFFSRVRSLPPYFGFSAQKKTILSAELASKLQRRGLSVDFSSRPEDQIVGPAWQRRLSSAKSTFVATGGASQVDRWGQLAFDYSLTERLPFLSDKGRYFFSSQLLPTRGNFSALSPRTFEAVACRAVIISPPGEVVGGFIPWEHFLPWTSSGSVEKIVSILRDNFALEDIAENALSVVRFSKDLTYSSFVSKFLKKELPSKENNSVTTRRDFGLDVNLLYDSADLGEEPSLFYAEMLSRVPPITWNSRRRAISVAAKSARNLKHRLFLEQVASGEISYLAIASQAVSAGQAFSQLEGFSPSLVRVPRETL